MEFKDHFSRQAAGYARYRPQYPDTLFTYLAELFPTHKRAWDCATGGGQAALSLARFFDEVIATDASASQIRRGKPHPKIVYRVCMAEDSGIEESSIDLITVAQAIHWFDFDAFFREAIRVSKPKGVMAIWGYGLLEIDPKIDDIIRKFYGRELVGYWPKERRHIDQEYRSIPFPFREMKTPKFEMTCQWDLNHLLGYLRTWSAVQRFRNATGEDPVTGLEPLFATSWSNREEIKQVVWPLFLRVASVDENRC